MAKKGKNNIEQAINKDGSELPVIEHEKLPSYMQDTIVSLTKVSQALAESGPLQLKQNINEYGAKTVQNEDTYTAMEICSDTLDVDKVVLGPFASCVMNCLYTMNTNGVKEFSIEQLANYLLKREVKFESLETNFQSAFDYMKIDSDGFPEIPEDQLDFYNQLHLLMHKLAKTFIRLDCTNLRYTTGEKVPDLLVMYGPLVPLTIYEGESPVTKRKRIMYRMSDKPIVYEYAEALRRLTKIPAQALSTNLPAKPDSVVLSDMLATWVQMLKNPNNSQWSPSIKFEGRYGLFNILNITKEKYPARSTLSRRKQRLKKDVELILKHFMSIGLIKSLTVDKTNGVITGYTVTV